MSAKRTAVLVSGTGSNMVALLRAMQRADHPAEPVIVLSNRPEAGGLARAAEFGVPTAVVDHRPFKGDRTAFDAEVQRRLDEAGVELVALAGFMRIMTDAMIGRWTGRMINIHPSILPAFKGLDTHARALAAGCAIHGCTVHEVTPELDSGRILGQAAVPVLAGDTPDALAARVLVEEHRLYPAVFEAFARDPDAARAQPIAHFAPA